MTQRSFTSTQSAECLECPWRTEGKGTLGRAAQHHDKTRHEVTATTVVHYARDREPTHQQEGLAL